MMMFAWTRYLNQGGRMAVAKQRIFFYSCSYTLLANIYHSVEPQNYEEVKGYMNWEKAMQVISMMP
jgi:hypothetical protein